jgi:hypothetical protein
MSVFIKSGIGTLILVSWFTAARADETSDFLELLEANTHSIRLVDGALSGPGADIIFDGAANSQFVAIGEEHYNYVIPDITTAMFTELQDRYGFHYFMTEQDPVMMEMMSAPPARGDLASINSLAQNYPMGVTFNSDEELKMLADIGRISKAADDVIWGCDQASGVTHALDQLLLSTKDPNAKAAIVKARSISAEKEAERDFSKGNYIYDAPTSDFVALKAAIDPIEGSHDEWLIDAIINASKVFGFYENGKNNLLPGYYENNRFREEHLKDLCLAKYRSAEQAGALPKALMKFGSWHLFEGLSPTRVHTIGDFFSSVARFNDRDFLSMYFVSRPQDLEENSQQLAFIWPFIEDLDAGEFAVVDLRPFRRYPNRALVEKMMGDDWKVANKEDFVRLVYGYDLIFFVGETQSATFKVVPQPEQ